MTHVGIDISKRFFDAYLEGRNRRFEYTPEGISNFISQLPENAHCLMESTGPYSFRLAEALSSAGKKVSVVNSLSVKRFAQMNLNRTKTDACDAKLLTDFSSRFETRPFVPLNDEKHRLKQRITALEGLKGQQNVTANLLESIKHLPRHCNDTYQILDNLLAEITKSIAELTRKIDHETRSAYADVCPRLLTVPGIGMGTLSMLLVLTDGLNNFKTSKSLAAFVGINPGTKESGTSVRGPGTISRLGHGALRGKLYMCSLTAMKKNKACRLLYERLVAKGKPKKVALVAVAHKLLKQLFGIAKAGSVYEENFGLAA